jgi:hypothetical protein
VKILSVNGHCGRDVLGLAGSGRAVEGALCKANKDTDMTKKKGKSSVYKGGNLHSATLDQVSYVC